jgi:hypothetical protein
VDHIDLAEAQMRFAPGCIVALLLSAPASAETARSWIFDDNPEAPALVYGAPESDDILIAISCEPGEKRMTIVEAVGSKKLNPGRTTTFRLSVGTVNLDLTGDAVANETDGSVNVEVIGAPNPRVFALLRAGPSLTIEVAGEKETIPLAGAAPHVPVLEKLCRK